MSKKEKDLDVVTLPTEETKEEKTLVIHIDWGLGRVIAMSWAITELAKKRKVKVVTSWPLVFWGNPYIESVHWVEDRRLWEDVIRWNDYFVLEPYTDPDFFNDGTNWLEIARKQLWLEKIANPVIYLAEHEKIGNTLPGEKPILFQPFGSTMMQNGADKSYRSIRIEDAQYIANRLIQAWFTVYVVERDDQPKLMGCQQLTVQDMRWLIALAARYPVLGCDSSMHHATKAFDWKAVVVWSGTDAGRFGYDTNINLRWDAEYHYVPFRLGIDFDTDIINQHTNIYDKAFLDKVADTAIETFQFSGNTPEMCACPMGQPPMGMPMMGMPMPGMLMMMPH